MFIIEFKVFNFLYIKEYIKTEALKLNPNNLLIGFTGNNIQWDALNLLEFCITHIEEYNKITLSVYPRPYLCKIYKFVLSLNGTGNCNMNSLTYEFSSDEKGWEDVIKKACQINNDFVHMINSLNSSETIPYYNVNIGWN